MEEEGACSYMRRKRKSLAHSNQNKVTKDTENGNKLDFEDFEPKEQSRSISMFNKCLLVTQDLNQTKPWKMVTNMEVIIEHI